MANDAGFISGANFYDDDSVDDGLGSFGLTNLPPFPEAFKHS